MIFVLISVCIATLQLDQTLFLATQQDEYDSFQGNIEIQDGSYQAECDCDQQGLQDIQEVKCQPSKIVLVENMSGQGADYEQMIEKLESYSNFTWAQVTRSSFRALDGRYTDQILGTPGGDAGEFILGLLVYQQVLDTQFSQEDVDYFFQEYLKCMGTFQFYMMTDQQAIEHVEKELVIQDLDIYNPEEEDQEDLLEALIEPNNIGDTHIRNLVQYPDLYSIQKDVVEMFIQAFYKVLWDDENALQESVYLEILEGSHEEEAFLEIRTNRECNIENVAPLVAPIEQGSSMSVLVNHLEIVKVRRGQLTEFFVIKMTDEGQNLLKTFSERINHYGMLFLDRTGSYIANGLPFYTANFV